MAIKTVIVIKIIKKLKLHEHKTDERESCIDAIVEERDQRVSLN